MTQPFTAPPCGWTPDTSCCTNWAEVPPATQTAALAYASLVMWAATGRRYGACPQTIRPCGRDCQGSGVSGYFWSGGMWLPYVMDGVWRNCWCGNAQGCCSCEPSCQVYLPGPVAAIAVTGVSQDGGVVDAATWRVDNGQWLVRTGGQCWISCQDYNVDSGVGTLFVTYSRGIAVPAALNSAAGVLACEWAKSCMGQPCALPQRVQSIARQGVTISMVDVDSLLERGLTGLTTVDQVIRSVNPYGLVSEMKMSSPDVLAIRATTIA